VQEKIPPRLRIPGQPPLLYGPTFDFVADASRVIEGTVREMDTGKPIKGVSVWAAAGYNNGVNAVSDADGRFRLVGLSRLKEYRLHATPDVKSPWLRRSLRVPDAAGVQPIRADIELVRGLTVTGRVIDRATGKGVKSGIRFVPLPGNKYFDKPGYDSYRFDRSMQATNAAGQFRLPIIPGGGVLLVQAHGSEKMIAGIRVSPYKLAEFDAADRKRVPVVGTGQDRRFIAAGNSLEFLGIENACKVVDPAGDAGTVTCDVYLDRGKELTVKIQDAAGQPLTGALVSGMTASFPITFPISESSCTVYALDPTQPRQLVVYHAGRKLAGKLTVRGDEKEPPVVKLTPVGSVTGRVLDGDGLPLAGADVYLSAPGVAAQELYRTLNRQHEAIRTNKDGRFRCDGLVADLKFGISFRKGNAFLVGEPQIGLRQVGPGKTLDLGDIRTKRFN
jgi:hypothetical protein